MQLLCCRYTSMEHIRAHILVSGRVQGVMFRVHAKKEAKILGLTGWTHNLLDGRVEIFCEGEKESIEKFIEWAKKGSPLSKVERVEVEYHEHKGEWKEFSIREFGF